jgi:hypothetical protein
MWAFLDLWILETWMHSDSADSHNSADDGMQIIGAVTDKMTPLFQSIGVATSTSITGRCEAARKALDA